jgi:YbgC/YbaW family acyl-CoA thioester hydrolase
MEVPAIPPSASFRFRTRRRTRWSDEDVQGVVNNAVYMTLFEEARHQYFGDLGLLEGGEFPFVLLQTNIRFLAPGRGGVEVEIELRTEEFTRTSFRQVGRIREVESGVVLAEKEALLVSWDPGARGKTATAEAFRDAVLAFEASA